MQFRALPVLIRALGVDCAAGPHCRRYGPTGILRHYLRTIRIDVELSFDRLRANVLVKVPFVLRASVLVITTFVLRASVLAITPFVLSLSKHHFEIIS